MSRGVLPNKMRGKASQTSISLKTRKGVMIPPKSDIEEHIITPRFLVKSRQQKKMTFL